MPQQKPKTDAEILAEIGVDPSEIKQAPKGFWESFLALAHPLKVAGDIYTVATTPLYQTLGSLASNTWNAGRAALSDYAAGDMDSANRNLIRASPLLGEPMVTAADQFNAGNYRGAAGTVAGVGALSLAPEVTRWLPRGVRVGGFARSGIPQVAEAVDFGLARGVPMNAGIATGRQNIQRLDVLTDATTIPGFYRNGEAQSAKGLARVGADLANDVRPGGRVTPIEAGESLHGKAMAEAEFYGRKESKAAQDLEALAAKHPQTVTLLRPGPGKKKVLVSTPVTLHAPVDVRAAKAALTPVYEEWLKTYEASKAQIPDAMLALRSIVTGDDFVSLSVALKNQSALGKMTEASGAANFKTVGEGVASKAFGEFHKAVEQTVDDIGGQKLYADRQQFTKDKWRRAEAIERVFPTKGRDVTTGQVFVDPVGGYRKLVGEGDKNLSMLEQMQQIAPTEMPNVGRAWVQEQLEHAATSPSGFGKHTSLKNAWDGLGDKTKAILFYDPIVRKNLDYFFTLQDLVGQRVNPSGTGGMNAMFQAAKSIGKAVGPSAAAYGAAGPGGVVAAQVVGGIYNLASYSPTVLKTIVQGGTIPLRTPARVATELGRASLAEPDISRPTQPQKVVTQAQLKALAAQLGTDVATQQARAVAEGYVIR